LNIALPPDPCPYRGLQPYTEEDRHFFFGRKRDEKIIGANLYASRLTILYGGSGVGKTSVLRAGTIPDLRKAPHVAVVFFNTWQNPDFETALKSSVAAAVSESTVLADPAKPLDELLLDCAKGPHGTIFLIFDQFEEYFLYHGPSPAERGFDAELARLVNRREIDAHVMLSIREDGLSKLDRFQCRIPNLLSNMLRLDHLDRINAEKAIRDPLGEYNKAPPSGQSAVEIEDALVEALLSDRDLMRPQDGTMRIQQADGVQERYETPLLQLVLTRLWNEERQADSQVLRLTTLQRLGGAKRIADRHLETVMARLSRAERDTAAKIFRFLVTPDGSKIAYTVPALAGSAELPKEKVQHVLMRLGAADTRILRTVASPGQPLRYEIFHDVLGAAISAWRVAYVRRGERTRRLFRVALYAAFLIGASAGFYQLIYMPWREKQPWASVRMLATGNIYDLSGDLAWIGRSTDEFKTHVSFETRAVSRLHLLVTRDLLALDVRSLLGTTVNAEILSYGVGRKIEPLDIVVLGGVAAFELATPRLAREKVAIPSPQAWAVLIDGHSRSFQYLNSNPSFVVRVDDRLVVEDKPTAATLLKIENIGKGDDIVIRIEDAPDTAKLKAKWKSGDYEYSENIVPESKPIVTFEKEKERADMADYCFVEHVALSYDSLPFQIVPILGDVEGPGTVAPRH
jgi:hypothetical protein